MQARLMMGRVIHDEHGYRENQTHVFGRGSLGETSFWSKGRGRTKSHSTEVKAGMTQITSCDMHHTYS